MGSSGCVLRSAFAWLRRTSSGTAPDVLHFKLKRSLSPPRRIEGPLYKLVRDRFNRYYQVKLEGIEGCGKKVRETVP